MRPFAAPGLLLAVTILIGTAHFAAGQMPSMGMNMPKTTLLVARLDAKQVVGGSSSTATATGAFVLDGEHHTVQYSLTYQGLASGGAKSIALYNFGAGKNGDAVKVLCGTDAQPCPAGASATITGSFERGDNRAIDNALIGEFDTGRVYVEIVGSDGKPEIRGQLGQNTAMVMFANYVAHLAPIAGTQSKGTGTAIYSEIYLPGKTSVFYAATVAGTAGAPVKASLANAAPTATAKFNAPLALPQLKTTLSRDRQTGGSLSGGYVINNTAANPLLASRLLKGTTGATGLVVTTTGHPNGELYGALVPVR